MRKLTPREEDDIRILIRHALEDMDYGGGGSYSLDPGVESKPDVRSIERAKRGIATIARLLEELRLFGTNR